MNATTEIKKKSSGRSPRHRARELAMQGIYQWRVAGGESAQIEQQIRADGKLGRYDKKLFSKILTGVIGQGVDLEPLLTAHLDRSLSELDPVEYAVLMLGTFELSQHIEVPYKVVINEAVELAKTFGGEDGYKYVNGVLDKLAPQLRAVEFSAK